MFKVGDIIKFKRGCRLYEVTHINNHGMVFYKGLKRGLSYSKTTEYLRQYALITERQYPSIRERKTEMHKGKKLTENNLKVEVKYHSTGKDNIFTVKYVGENYYLYEDEFGKGHTITKAYLSNNHNNRVITYHPDDPKEFVVGSSYTLSNLNHILYTYQGRLSGGDNKLVFSRWDSTIQDNKVMFLTEEEAYNALNI